MPLRRHLAALVALTLAASPAVGQEVRFGFGADDIRGSGTTATFGVEYRPEPAFRIVGAPIGLGVAADIDSRGDVWGGAGLVASAALGGGLTLQASAMPGASSRIDRNGSGRGGPTLRTRLGLDLDVTENWRAGITFSHRLHSGGGRSGPGVMVTFTREF